MSLFEHVIGAKTNFCRTDKNNTLTEENTFNGVVNLNGDVNGLEISDIQNLQSELEERATIIQLDSETEQRITSDTLLQTNIDSVQTNLNNETISRADADDTLQDNIDVVQLNLDNETTDRANSDNNLSNEIQLETLNRTDADTLLTTNLTNEETARINADTTLQANIDLKSNIDTPTFTGTVKIEKADNYGQIELTDTKPTGAGIGGGITFNGVYGAHGQITGLAHIKAKKSNATIGDYHGDLSLSVREDGGGGYTEIIRLRGEDSKTIISGGMEVAGTVKIEKADNYGQIELTDTTPASAGVGAGITLKGVYGAHGQITSFAHIKAKKSNSTILDYHGDLSLSVREDGSGGYTEIIRLEGETSRTVIKAGLNFSNLPTTPDGLVSGDVWSNSGVLTIIA
jgi:hypothetical protein